MAPTHSKHVRDERVVNKPTRRNVVYEIRFRNGMRNLGITPEEQADKSNFQYYGGDYLSYDADFVCIQNQSTVPIPRPKKTFRCVCGQKIEKNAYVKYRDMIIVLGSCCINRYMPDVSCRRCVECGERNRRRVINRCTTCSETMCDRCNGPKTNARMRLCDSCRLCNICPRRKPLGSDYCIGCQEKNPRPCDECTHVFVNPDPGVVMCATCTSTHCSSCRGPWRRGWGPRNHADCDDCRLGKTCRICDERSHTTAESTNGHIYCMECVAKRRRCACRTWHFNYPIERCDKCRVGRCDRCPNPCQPDWQLCGRCVATERGVRFM